jgi:hypothetical protein
LGVLTPSAEEVFEKQEKEEERKTAFKTVHREANKLPGLQRKVPAAIMGEDAVKTATQRIGIGSSTFYRERDKVRRRLKKLRPIWVRFGKAMVSRASPV